MDVPDVIDDGRAGEDPIGISEKIFQQGILLVGECDVLAGTPDSMRDRVEFEVRGGKTSGRLCSSTPQQRPNANRVLTRTAVMESYWMSQT